jgi:type II secretory pathway component GspD/PulD (secretin)
MIKARTIAAVLVGLALVLASAGLAQEAKRPELRQEIVKLKYVKNNQVLSVLYTFLSPQGRLNPNPESGVITISDYPENVEKILSVIREVDVKPADLQFTIQLVLGSTAPDEKTDDAIKDDPVIRELKQMLKYKSFSLLDTSYVRALDRQRSQVTMGRAAELRLDLMPKYIKDDKEDLIQVEATLYMVGPASLMQTPQGPQSLAAASKTLVTSNFTLKSGEKTVVGVSKMDGGDKGLILIISGKLLK